MLLLKSIDKLQFDADGVTALLGRQFVSGGTQLLHDKMNVLPDPYAIDNSGRINI
jgi:hypothetical protein